MIYLNYQTFKEYILYIYIREDTGIRKFLKFILKYIYEIVDIFSHKNLVISYILDLPDLVSFNVLGNWKNDLGTIKFYFQF